MERKVNPTDLYTPSVFVVSSPLQILYSFAIIRQLQIKKYRIVVFYLIGDPRKEQMLATLDYFGLKNRGYIGLNTFNAYFYKYFSLLHRYNKYKRLFIGDFRNYYMMLIGSCYVSDNASVVYFDDGNITVTLLKDNYSGLMPHYWSSRLNNLANKRGFVLNRNLFTIYNDIPNDKYDISSLDLKNVFSLKQNESKERCGVSGVFVIGTNIEVYCNEMNISREVFIQKLDVLFNDLRYKYTDDAIFYIPHGRDKSYYALEFCEKYGFEFINPKMMVELEILDKGYIPKMVYGFNYTALYNLKKMYPETRVVNMIFKNTEVNDIYRQYLIISEYYQKNGIELEMVSDLC